MPKTKSKEDCRKRLLINATMASFRKDASKGEHRPMPQGLVTEMDIINGILASESQVRTKVV